MADLRHKTGINENAGANALPSIKEQQEACLAARSSLKMLQPLCDERPVEPNATWTKTIKKDGRSCNVVASRDHPATQARTTPARSPTTTKAKPSARRSRPYTAAATSK